MPHERMTAATVLRHFRFKVKNNVSLVVALAVACTLITVISWSEDSFRNYRQVETLSDFDFGPYDTSLRKLNSESINCFETFSVSQQNVKSGNDTLSSGHIIDKFVTQSKTVIIIGTNQEGSMKRVNDLAFAGFADGIDYFVAVCNKTYAIKKESAEYITQALRKHPVHDIGAVIVENNIIAVHRNHFAILCQLFPDNLNFDIAIRWIMEIYGPYHITKLKLHQAKGYYKDSLKYEYPKGGKNKNVLNAKERIRNFIVSHKAPMVVSYSFYGSSNRYIDGALVNVDLIKTIYLNWTMWVYHDNTSPEHVLSYICAMDHVTCINMTDIRLKNKMSWRFLIASVDFISRFIVRDIDSRLSVREKAAVDEWIESGKTFHVMRDHPSHTKYAISGGMWGGTRLAIPDIDDILLKNNIGDKYMHDMNFLNKLIWPRMKHSVYQHDSFSCEKFGGGHPFPTKRIGLEHVGSVYINGQLRKVDTDILQKTKPNERCIKTIENNTVIT